MGRALDNAMLNIGQKDIAKSGLADLGFRIEDIISQEHDAALGNGGLGRLAACFLDSLASLDYPAWGYGLRYRYGIFKQEIIDGYQVEVPDYWLGSSVQNLHLILLITDPILQTSILGNSPAMMLLLTYVYSDLCW